jgi:hypothetical protein
MGSVLQVPSVAPFVAPVVATCVETECRFVTQCAIDCES